MLSSSLLSVVAAAASLVGGVTAQVTATGPNGPTNPSAPGLDGKYNQTSTSRLISIDSVDDFCLWGPETPGAMNTIGNTEPYVVAWCTKPRNGARLIPDGTIKSAHFVKTPNYVQIGGLLDGTKLNIPAGDDGGELDPHGAEGTGNPIGGNVTSNVSGQDVFYEEWMSFMSATEFCFRVCTSENSTYPAAIMCQHEIDLLGCRWVMPGNYEDNSFTTCDADAAFPPGVYPIGSAGSGTTSTFHQRYTNTVPGNEFTIGVTVTPTAAFSTPASSNCVTATSISNGIAISGAAAAGSASVTSAASGASASATGAARSSSSTGRSGTAAPTSAASAGASAAASASASTSRTSGSTASMVNFSVLWAGVTGAILIGLVGGVVLL